MVYAHTSELFDEIIGLFLFESESTGDLALTLEYGKQYLFIMLFGLLPFAISNVYASTMRETGEVVQTYGGQGIAVGSSWSRGQAWGLYGFTLSYIHTGEERYLNAAKQVAKGSYSYKFGARNMRRYIRV